VLVPIVSRLLIVGFIVFLAGGILAVDQYSKAQVADRTTVVTKAERAEQRGDGSAIFEVYVRPASNDVLGILTETLRRTPLASDPASVKTAAQAIFVMTMLLLLLAFLALSLDDLVNPFLVGGLALAIGVSVSTFADVMLSGRTTDIFGVAIRGHLVAVVNYADLAIAIGAVCLLAGVVLPWLIVSAAGLFDVVGDRGQVARSSD
jgi:hypothetical protein